MVKSQYNYKGDLHCPSSQGQNCYATKSSPVRLARLYFSNTDFVSRLAFTTLARLKPRRVKGGMSLWNGMWHGLLNDIILENVIYAECLKEIIIKLFEKSVIFWRQQLAKAAAFLMLRARPRWQSNRPRRTLWFLTVDIKNSLFLTATRILLAFITRAAWQHWHRESRPLKKRCLGIGRSRFLLL